ncbi:branched-chain amino acid ABC transporter ATP-binding protein [Acuticoccus sediminis]|uniref:Branched-chain amino acid ABC transporter ATP-binding protein n=1 Tax=Acuticoccus sediminis TaxID=2184697 RepID=A0A8B2NYK7_9HYPH|nr:ABC transporter ATP-binding protein [Acuticoccus sediminis]RAI02442.1 branched-chain amino acid ABC transporter ATP-binding protein [Acuticoccus sediminis]
MSDPTPVSAPGGGPVPSAEPILKVAGLEAGYGDIQILWGVDLDVMAGEIVCLVGSNGAGKTTLLKTISGLVPATAGSVRLDGAELAGAAPDAVLAAGIAHVPEGRRLFRTMSVRDNLLMGAYLRPHDADLDADLDRVMTMFPRLAERARQDAGTLSGGEQQMCAIGRGIMSRPKVLMIDELSLGLAPRAVELLSETLVEVNRAGTTILLIEQDVMTALEISDRGFVLDRGRVVMSGTPDVLAEAPEVREAYIGA